MAIGITDFVNDHALTIGEIKTLPFPPFQIEKYDSCPAASPGVDTSWNNHPRQWIETEPVFLLMRRAIR